MDDNSLEVRQQQDLEDALLEADNVIMKKYMKGISNYEVKKLPLELKNIDLNTVFRLNKIDKLVYNADENNLEKLMNVYNAVGLSGGSVVNIIISDGKNIDYYIGTRAGNVNEVATCQDVLVSSMLGNFQGTSLTLQKKDKLNECINNIFESNKEKTITVVSGIPGYRDEKNKENKKFIQGMERVINSMNGKKFALVTISSPLTSDQIATVKDGYENLYTQISPFSETQLSYNESDSNAVAESITDGITKTIGVNLSNTVSNSTTETDSVNKSKSFNGSLIILGGGKTKGTSHSTGVQKGTSVSNGKNSATSDSHQVGKTDTYTNTSGRSLQIKIENKAVKDLMNKIDCMVKRIEDGTDLGLWNSATYCIADNAQNSRVLASAIEAISRGDETSIESFTVESWNDTRKSNIVQEYLKKMVHPVILVEGSNEAFEVNPTSLINGKELVIAGGLPQKSVPGLPVSEMVSFSRNVVKEINNSGEQIKLGHIYHMGEVENVEVSLDVESLSSHTLITGSTGSGKSNTVYHILNEIRKKGIKFLVVEPAKGEYKNVFGNNPDVKVYGTNEKFTNLLRINPFKFPNSVHVLEHIDRLIEIFNVCWPMYAAMPAVLKDAVLCAYESCGWDLENSNNCYGQDVYPTFKDLQRELISVLDRSAYSDEVKGNYIGSLATRVKSLTNGINGKIFSSNAIGYEELFDENVIIDLSRVGSSETKSLIMGLLVMNLNEYRMDQSLYIMNQNMRHVTVLEEAHNLLKNSSINTGSEDGGNLAGKSVEMITNSIAEMRTYGEGFIIVDQSPNAIDISAIRNTNTKIIMRLPEDNDRQQAGKSAALKEEQILELAKLHRGIAVVYQNNWLDPVLCAIDKADIEEKSYVYSCENGINKADNSNLLALLLKNRIDEKVDYNIDDICNNIEKLNISTKTKIKLKDVVNCERNNKKPELLEENSFKQLSDIVVEILDMQDKLHRFSEFSDNCVLLQNELNKEIMRNSQIKSKELQLAISQCIVREIVEEESDKVDMYSKWREFAVEQRKMV